MDLNAMLHGIASCGFFPSRAFLPAFLTALLLRFGNDLPWVRSLPVVANTPDAPTWFTHGITLAVLGLLAALEVVASKDDDIEEILESVERFLKPAAAVLCFLGVLSVRDRRLIEEIATPAQQAGILDSVWVLGAGLLVNYLTSLRADLRLALRATDEEDILGLRRALSWLEDAWAFFGMLLVVLYPLLMLLVLGLVLGALRGCRWVLEKREALRLEPCSACGTPVFPSALECPGCHHPREAPRGIGFFGQSLRTPAPDPTALPLDLAEKRRCPRCATRLPQRHPRQRCPACGHDVFGSPEFRQEYLAAMEARLGPTLGLGLAFSLVPIAGLVPGILLVRHRLAAPFSRYLPAGRRFWVRWGLRLVFVLLLTIHWIPGLGGVVVPIIGWLAYGAYRRGFVALCGQAQAEPAALGEPSLSPTAVRQVG